MRSRPRVTMRYAAKAALPGQQFGVELTLASKSETPVDFIETSLRAVETLWVGQGEAHEALTFERLRQTAREKKRVLTPGEHRFRYTLDLPKNAAPSYWGVRRSLTYWISVHVSIPWWPDRKVQYVLPMLALPATGPIPLTPRVTASGEGPHAGKVYAEVSIDRDVVEPGGVLAGAVSVSNTAARRIRQVLLVLTARETITSPRPAVASADHLVAVLVDGSPPEGEAVPFKIRVPPSAPASYASSSFRLDWLLVVRVVVAFSSDTGVVVPLTVVRPPPGARERPPGRYYPVGRDRFSLVWAAVADKLGMVLDADARTLRASSGQASLAVHGVYDGKTYALRFELAWPPLGIDLHVATRSWTDLVVGGWRPPSEAARDKLVLRGREPEQLAALFDAPVLDVLAAYTDVVLEDDHANLTLDVPGTHAAELEAACRSAASLLRRVARWSEVVPPPRTMRSALPAWQAFARKTSGTLETGSLSVRGASIGVDRFSVETYWVATDEALATVVTFPFDPPLADAPSFDSPSLTQDARDLWRAVRETTTELDVTVEQLSWRTPGATLDPGALLPVIEETARLVRALRRGVSTGPYR